MKIKCSRTSTKFYQRKILSSIFISSTIYLNLTISIRYTIMVGCTITIWGAIRPSNIALFTTIGIRARMERKY